MSFANFKSSIEYFMHIQDKNNLTIIPKVRFTKQWIKCKNLVTGQIKRYACQIETEMLPCNTRSPTDLSKSIFNVFRRIDSATHFIHDRTWMRTFKFCTTISTPPPPPYKHWVNCFIRKNQGGNVSCIC